MNLPHALGVTLHRTLAELSEVVAQRIAQLAAQAIATHGIFRLALAGGDTPRGCYEQLRGLPVDWAHVHIYFGDERCVPRGDPRRNDRMAHDTLLAHVPIPPAQVHAMPAECGARVAAMEYDAVIAQARPLDLVLLGLGRDGHTASLFPGNPATAQDAPVVPVFHAPKPPPERVSLSLGTLNAARHKLFLVAGESKRAALAGIVQGEVLPAARVTGAEWHIECAAVPPEIMSNEC